MRKATVAARLAKLEAGNTRSLTSWESLFLWAFQDSFENPKSWGSSERETDFFVLVWFFLLVWSKSDIWGPDFSHIKNGYVLVLHSYRSKIWLREESAPSGILFAVYCHPLNCMYASKISLTEFYSFAWGEGVEIGTRSLLCLEPKIVDFSSQAKKQQLRFSKLSGVFQKFSFICVHKFHLSVYGHSALHQKWDSLKLSQLEHPKMEELKSQVTFKSQDNSLENPILWACLKRMMGVPLTADWAPGKHRQDIVSQALPTTKSTFVVKYL